MESLFPELKSPYYTKGVRSVNIFSLKLLLLSVLPTNSGNLCPCSFIVRERDFVTNDNIKETDWKDVNYLHVAQSRDCKHGIKHSGSKKRQGISCLAKNCQIFKTDRQ